MTFLRLDTLIQLKQRYTSDLTKFRFPSDTVAEVDDNWVYRESGLANSPGEEIDPDCPMSDRRVATAGEHHLRGGRAPLSSFPFMAPPARSVVTVGRSGCGQRRARWQRASAAQST